jgi:hypothetical protein
MRYKRLNQHYKMFFSNYSENLVPVSAAYEFNDIEQKFQLVKYGNYMSHLAFIVLFQLYMDDDITIQH